VARLRAALDAAGFTAPAVRKALLADADLLAGSQDVVITERRLVDAPPTLPDVVRLFVRLPVPSTSAGLALTGSGLGALVDLGLATERRPAAVPSHVPHDHLLIASDELGVGGADHVAGVHRRQGDLVGLSCPRKPLRRPRRRDRMRDQALLSACTPSRVVATT
jgi:hypothetical protein